MRRWRLRGMSVTTRPALPARPVRPARCRYVLYSSGASAWITRSMSSTWMPRAATSVATSTLTRAARELLQVARAARLVEVAVQRDRTDAVVLEVVGELLGEGAGAGEDEGLAVAVRRAGRRCRACRGCSMTNTRCSMRRGRLVFAGDLVHGRVDEELVDERGDALVEGRREEQLLAARCGVADDALHGLEEAEVAHVVGLVEHRDDDLGEVEAALLDEVLDAAGGADHDVDAALERADLAVLRHAAVDLRGEEADALRDGLHGAVDLQGELAGRGEDERAGLAAHLALAARLARLGPERHETLDRGGAEGDGLARAGLAAAEHVATLEHDRDGRGLDRERRLGAELLQHAHDVGAEAEVGEGHAVDRVGLDGLGLEALEHHVVGRREARAAVLRRVEARRAAARLVEAGAFDVAARRAGIAIERTGRAVLAVERTSGTLVTVDGGAHGRHGRTNEPGGPDGRTNERDARHGHGGAHGRRGRTNEPGGPERSNERAGRSSRSRRAARSSRSNERAGRSERSNERAGRSSRSRRGARSSRSNERAGRSSRSRRGARSSRSYERTGRSSR